MAEGSTSKNYPGVKGLGLRAFVPGRAPEDIQPPLDENNDGHRSDDEIDEALAERGRRRGTENTKGKAKERRDENELGDTGTLKGGSGAGDEEEEAEPEDQFEKDKRAFGSFLEELDDDESQDRLLAWIAGKLNETEPVAETNKVEKEQVVPEVKKGDGAVSKKDAVGEVKETVKIDFGSGEKFFEQTVVAPDALVTLLTNKRHLPLTVCTTRAFNEVLNNLEHVKYTKQHNRLGEKRELIDVSYWPSELTISKDDWREAYPNFGKVLGKAFSPAVCSLFNEHFEYLCSRPEFHMSFAAILRFDIDIRKRFFLGDRVKFAVGDNDYKNKLLEMKILVMQEASSQSAETSTSSGGRSFVPTKRSAPDNFATGRSDSFRSFRYKEKLCLVCAQFGHHAASCGKQSLPNGKPVYATWYNERLVSTKGRTKLCIFWNLGGRDCRTSRCPGTSGHACSFCGSPDHCAASKQCLRA